MIFYIIFDFLLDIDQMLDIIRNKRVFDLSQVYNIGTVYNDVKNMMRDDKPDIASYNAANQTKIQSAIDKLAASYTN